MAPRARWVVCGSVVDLAALLGAEAEFVCWWAVPLKPQVSSLSSCLAIPATPAPLVTVTVMQRYLPYAGGCSLYI